MKIMLQYAGAMFFATLAACGQEIRTAGELFVYLDATNVTGLAEGVSVASWTNCGTLAEFVPAVPGKGATYAANIGGAAALQFDGSTQCGMALAGHTNNATKGGVPLSILGTNVWSAEVWVYNPAGGGAIETLLTWTSRRDAAVYRMMEMRYYNTTDAIEHLERNLGWGGFAPAFGQWHHIACTRDAACTNRLYLDGRFVNELFMGGVYMLNLASNSALFTVGAVDTPGGWDYPLSGSIAVVRVHDGTLSAADVLNNFTVERSRFGGGWQKAGAGAWNSSANWENGTIPSSGQPVYINNGGTAIYDGAPYTGAVNTGMWYAVHGGMSLTGGGYTALPTFVDTYIRVGVGTGSAFTLSLDGGTFATAGNILRLGDTVGATGTLNLNAGGKLITTRIQKGSGAASLNADGGTLQTVATAADFLQGLDSARVKAGGLTFDVPTNVTVSVYQALQEDPSSRGGGLSKTGPGTLNLYGANTVAGALAISGGLLTLQSGALATSFAAPVALANGGQIGWNQTGGATILANHLTADSLGSLILYAVNANDSINLSMLPGVALRMEGTFTYTGTLTPYTNRYLFAPNNGTVTFSQQIVDQPGVVGRVESRGTTNGFLKLTGDNSYTGGTLLESGGLIMTHANALGIGAEGVQDIVCGSGAVLRVQTPLNSETFFSRVAAAPYMSLQLSGAGLTNTLDLSGCPNIFTGTENTNVKSYFTGTLTPYGNTYLLGNTGLDTGDHGFGFAITNLTDGAEGVPRSVLVKGIGVVDTRNSASYSGGTRVEDGGKIIVIGDRGFGTVPALFDPSNIVFNNSGVLRTETPNVTLVKTRGIVFGPGTTRIHASGPLPGQFLIPGDISGTGTLRMTDMGRVGFGGTNNTYNGRVQLESSYGAMMIGDGTNFSWTSTGGIVGTQTRGWLYLNNGGNDIFSDSFSGNGILTKKGLGTVTLATAQTNKSLPTNTVVEAGTLRYGVSGALASGPGAGFVDLWAKAFLDVNGFATVLNGLIGRGCVTNSANTAVALQVGDDTLSSCFEGRIAAPLTLTKSGAATLTLTHPDVTREPVAVTAGTLTLWPGITLTNGLNIAPGALVQATGTPGLLDGLHGLRGEYYDGFKSSSYKCPELGNTLAEVEAGLTGRIPNLIIGSSSFGTFFDSGKNVGFPDKYSGAVDTFVVRWTGRFMAETAGTYAFRIRADDAGLLFLDETLVVTNRTGGGYATGSVTLTQGEHDIAIIFYDAGSDQIITVQMTPPGGAQALLPQRLLSVAPVTVGGLAGGGAGSRLGMAEDGLLRVIQESDITFGGFGGTGITNSTIEKLGAGVLTLSDTSSFRGVTRLIDGGLTLAEGVSHTGAFKVVNGTLTVSGGTDLDSAPVLIGSLDVAGDGELALAGTTMLRINQITDGAFMGTLTGGTADSVIAKDGAAEWVIAVDVSAYPGTWEVMAGKLVIGDGGLLAPNVEIATRAGGMLVFRSPTNIVFAGTVSGTGAIRNEGPGTLTLTGEISCGIQVAAGQTVIHDGAAVTGLMTLGDACKNEGTLIFTTPGAFRINAPITGGGTVRMGPDTTLVVGQGGLTDSQILLLEGGTLLLNNGGGALGFDDNTWVTAGIAQGDDKIWVPAEVTRFVDDGLGGTILELTPNLPLRIGAAYYRERIKTLDPWIIDLTFRKGASGASPGDGFGVFFQNDSRGTNALPTSWYGSVSPYLPSFGFQYYLMPENCYLAWVENGVLTGKVTTNLFTQFAGEFTARMTFDGTQMVVDMQQGTTTYSMTNITAGARLATLGTHAWMGIVGGTGGSKGEQFIDTFTFSYTAEAGLRFTNNIELAAGTASTLETSPSAMADVLPLLVGDLVFNADSSLDAVSATGLDPTLTFVRFGDLRILGNSALTLTSAGKALLGGDTWTFNAGAVLTVTGAISLPETVYIVINGEIPDDRMNLVDFRGTQIENQANVTFVLVGGDVTERIIFRNGWLYTIGNFGTLIQVR